MVLLRTNAYMSLSLAIQQLIFVCLPWAKLCVVTNIRFSLVTKLVKNTVSFQKMVQNFPCSPQPAVFQSEARSPWMGTRNPLSPGQIFFFFYSAAPLVSSFLAEAPEAACTSFQVQGYLSPYTLGREGDLPFLSEASPRQTSTLLLLITTYGTIFKCCPVKPCSVLMKRKEMGINK